MSASQSPLLRALRRNRDEAQLTQIIAQAAGSDPIFASKLASVFVTAAPRSKLADIGSVPSELDCTAELNLLDSAGRDLGRVDLCFRDGTGFMLFVELKLHSGYGVDQVSRYLSALDALSADRSGLVAVTRNLPRYGEHEAQSHPRWLGSVRWAHIVDELVRVEHSDPFTGVLWKQLLTYIRHEGDFGLMDFDPKAVEAWARWKEGREILTQLLEEIYEPAMDLIRGILAGHQGVDASADIAAPILHNNKRLVWPWGESLNIQIAVPADNAERLRLQFVGGRGEPLFTAEARHENDYVLDGAGSALEEATNVLRSKGFETGRHWGSYWSRPHRQDEWLYRGSETGEVLLSIIELDVRDLADSGIFEALPKAPAPAERGSREAEIRNEGL